MSEQSRVSNTKGTLPVQGQLPNPRRSTRVVTRKTVAAEACRLICAALLLHGCVSAKYKPADDETPPAEQINLTAAQPPLAVKLHSVIVYHGPGSWKRDAYWDEYVVSVQNTGTQPFVVASAGLTDFNGVATAPGDEPGALATVSRTWWDNAKDSQFGNMLALGAGTVVVGGIFVAGSTAAAVSSVLGGGASAAGAASTWATAASVVGIAAPVYGTYVLIKNRSNKRFITEEFQKRRLPLPRTIAPGEVAQGSLFFRISPGPQSLLLRGRVGGTGESVTEVAVDLAPLAGLHRRDEKTTDTTTQAKAASQPEPVAPP